MPRGTDKEAKFAADAMLGSLARKLRAFGFDTTYFRDGEDAELVSLAVSEGRVILTSDRELARLASRRRVPVITIVGDRESQRIAKLKTGANLLQVRLVPGGPRCSVCNGTLESIAKSQASGRVPPSALSRHRKFYRCVDCGRFYWRGAHWKKLRWLQRRLAQNPLGSVSR